MSGLCRHGGFWPDLIGDGWNNPVQDRTRAAHGALAVVNVIKLIIFPVPVSLDPALGESASPPNSDRAGAGQVRGLVLRSSHSKHRCSPGVSRALNTSEGKELR